MRFVLPYVYIYFSLVLLDQNDGDTFYNNSSVL